MKKFIEDYKKLPKEIYILSLATMINRIGDFVVPFLTLYLSQKLGISLPITGIIVAISGFIKVPGSYLGGRLNDKYSSKLIFVIFQTISALLLLTCGFITNPIISVPLLILFSFTVSMIRTPTMAMISDLLPGELRKLGYIVRYIGINVGVAIGLAVAGFIYNYNTVFLFIGDGLTMLISVIMVAIGIKSSNLNRIRKKSIGENEKAEEGNIITVLSKRKPLVLYMFFCSCLWIIFEQTKFAMPLTLNIRFGADGPVLFGLLISINAVTATILALFQDRLTKNIKPLNQIIFGGVLFTIGFGLYSVTVSYSSFIIATIIWSIGEVFIFTNASVFVVNHCPENFRGRVTSIFSIFFATLGTLGIMLSERLITNFGVNFTWQVLAIFTFITSIMLYILRVKYFKD
ncbi:MAG: MFS transporter [Spirochaetaceae bacterium]